MTGVSKSSHGNKRLVEIMKLTFWQKLQLLINGHCFLRWEKREGWKDYLPIFLVKCKKHGLFESHPHGYRGYFVCPKCVEEDMEKIGKSNGCLVSEARLKSFPP